MVRGTAFVSPPSVLTPYSPGSQTPDDMDKDTTKPSKGMEDLIPHLYPKVRRTEAIPRPSNMKTPTQYQRLFVSGTSGEARSQAPKDTTALHCSLSFTFFFVVFLFIIPL